MPGERGARLTREDVEMFRVWYGEVLHDPEPEPPPGTMWFLQRRFEVDDMRATADDLATEYWRQQREEADGR